MSIKKIVGAILVSTPFILWLWLFKISLFETWREAFIAIIVAAVIGIALISFLHLTIGLGLRLLRDDRNSQ